MTLKQFLTWMAIGTALCWSMFLLVLFRIDPNTGNIAILFFYSSLFLSIIGALSIIEICVRIFLLKKAIIFTQVKTSFRHSVMFSILFITVLFLQSKKLLAWWNILFLIIALTVLECLFMSIKYRPNTE
ncbi:hypothetical protein ACFL23_01420 [Patescibacteria group bacterium]